MEANVIGVVPLQEGDQITYSMTAEETKTAVVKLRISYNTIRSEDKHTTCMNTVHSHAHARTLKSSSVAFLLIKTYFHRESSHVVASRHDKTFELNIPSQLTKSKKQVKLARRNILFSARQPWILIMMVKGGKSRSIFTKLKRVARTILLELAHFFTLSS